ncbi:MAG: hypothetical protein FJZ56_05970 [Chlamydiae bacterium]|nr:hypothetical protein [Chlamydiota bacterium]
MAIINQISCDNNQIYHDEVSLNTRSGDSEISSFFHFSKTAIFEMTVHKISSARAAELLIFHEPSAAKIFYDREIAIKINFDAQQVESVRRIVKCSSQIFYLTTIAYDNLNELGLLAYDDKVVQVLENPKNITPLTQGYFEYKDDQLLVKVYEPLNEIAAVRSLLKDSTCLELNGCKYVYIHQAKQDLSNLDKYLDSSSVKNILDQPSKIVQTSPSQYTYYRQGAAVQIDVQKQMILRLFLAFDVPVCSATETISLISEMSAKAFEELKMIGGEYCTLEDVQETLLRPYRVIIDNAQNFVYHGPKLVLLVSSQGYSILGIRVALHTLDAINRGSNIFCYTMAALQALKKINLAFDDQDIIDAISYAQGCFNTKDEGIIEYKGKRASILIDSRNNAIMSVRLGIDVKVSNPSQPHADSKFYQYNISGYNDLSLLMLKVDDQNIKQTLEQPIKIVTQMNGNMQYIGSKIAVIIDPQAEKIVAVRSVVHVQKSHSDSVYFYSAEAFNQLKEYKLTVHDEKICKTLKGFHQLFNDGKRAYCSNNMLIMIDLQNNMILNVVPLVDATTSLLNARFFYRPQPFQELLQLGIDPFSPKVLQTIISAAEVLVKEEDCIEYVSEDLAVTINKKEHQIVKVRRVIEFPECIIEDKKRFFCSNRVAISLKSKGLYLDHIHILSALIDPDKTFSLGNNQYEYRVRNISIIIDHSTDEIISYNFVTPIAVCPSLKKIQLLSYQKEIKHVAYDLYLGDQSKIKDCLENPDHISVDPTNRHIVRYAKNGVTVDYDSMLEKVINVKH